MASAKAEAIFRKIANYFRDSGAATARSRSCRPWGSDPTAAGGGRREGSEWQRSARNKSASAGEVSAGHRNRGSEATQIRNLHKQVATLPWSVYKKMASAKAEAIFRKIANYFRDSGAATATETVIPTMGERPDRRRWREEGGERVAAVGEKQVCFSRRGFCRAPQQVMKTVTSAALG